MQAVIETIKQWHGEEKAIAQATVITTWGSAPRKVGAIMAVTSTMNMVGSVSGGCVEGAVIEEAMSVLEKQRPVLLHFDVANEMAWEVGLACGGSIDIFVEPIDQSAYTIVDSWVKNKQSGAIGTMVKGDEIGRKLFYSQGNWQGNIIHPMAKSAVEQAYSQRQTGCVKIDDQHEIFVDMIMPAPQLIIVGGVHIAIALVKMAQIVEFEPIVIDPRGVFGSTDRFPNVELHQQWPSEAFEHVIINDSTAVALLTHDPKIDDQALDAVLTTSAFYIGALGSRQTADKRRKRLIEKGYTNKQIDQINGPIGLNINAQTPEEIAVAIMAEIIGKWRLHPFKIG